MPVSLGTKKTVEIEEMESIARIELFTYAFMKEDDWRLVVHFEIGQYENGTLTGSTREGLIAERRFADVKNDPEVIQAMLLMKKKAYQWRDENIAEQAEQRRLAKEAEQRRLAEEQINRV